MSTSASYRTRVSRWLSWLVPLLQSDFVDALVIAWRLGRRVLAAKTQGGMYEVLAFESRLELLDAKGRRARYQKRQRVRFLQDNIIAYQDLAWGDGDIFADYKCSPGIAVDRYQEGHRHHVLISLRETKNRGDVQEFHIERTIRDGFTGEVESFQTEVNHETHKLAVSVVFPKQRHPKRVTLTEQNTTRVTELGPKHRLVLPDGRQQMTWHTARPRLFEAYILRWEW